MFEFKQFTIGQDASAMKVGTDGVLLGAWCGVEQCSKRVLDVGTGTGLIALMVAQRSATWGVRIDALEIDEQSAMQAEQNVLDSPWSDRVRVVHGALQKYAVGFQAPVYDHIISNPPYFIDSLTCPDSRRTVARHTTDLTYTDLLKYGCMMLRRSGRISLILPFDHLPRILECAKANSLHITRRTDVFSTENSEVAKRSMVEFTHVLLGDQIPDCIESKLVVEQGERHCYSEQYRELTRNFYLKF